MNRLRPSRVLEKAADQELRPLGFGLYGAIALDFIARQPHPPMLADISRFLMQEPQSPPRLYSGSNDAAGSGAEPSERDRRERCWSSLPRPAASSTSAWYACSRGCSRTARKGPRASFRGRPRCYTGDGTFWSPLSYLDLGDGGVWIQARTEGAGCDTRPSSRMRPAALSRRIPGRGRRQTLGGDGVYQELSVFGGNAHPALTNAICDYLGRARLAESRYSSSATKTFSFKSRKTSGSATSSSSSRSRHR